jgi:hypothetical protein
MTNDPCHSKVSGARKTRKKSAIYDRILLLFAEFAGTAYNSNRRTPEQPACPPPVQGGALLEKGTLLFFGRLGRRDE